MAILSTELGVKITTQPRPYCPECGAQMYLRLPRPGGKLFDPFWGCSLYPECRGSRNIDPRTGEPFPDQEPEPYDPPMVGDGYGEGGMIRTITNRETGALEGWHCTNCDQTWKVARQPKHVPGCEVGEAERDQSAKLARKASE